MKIKSDSERPGEVIYTPESQMKKPLELLRNMFSDLLASRELAWRLFIRDISSQYRQSLLGYAWAFLGPLITTLLWIFLNSQGILNVGETSIPYPVYVMTGTMFWQGFVDAMKMPLGTVIESKAMLTKVNFPREALILTGFYQVLFRAAFRMVLLVAVLFWFNISIPPTVILAPFGVIMMMLFGLMIGVMVTPLGVLYRDVERTMAIVASIWFFMTPVVYPAPTAWPASLIVRINPMTSLLVTTRELMTIGTLSQFGSFAIVSGCTVFFLFAAWVFYRISMPHLVERMSA